MKKLPVLLCIVLLSACEVPSDNLVQRNFIQYEINSQTPFSGVATKYHENGQLYFKRNYTNGRLNGLDEWYYENGQLKEKITYKDGEKHGLTEWYGENGLERTYSPVCYQNGKEVEMSKWKKCP